MVFRVYAHDSIDAAFIDGDHSYEGALGDLQAVWPKLKNGATVVVHDTNMEPVMKALKGT